jgi:hypothetical protein
LPKLAQCTSYQPRILLVWLDFWSALGLTRLTFR